jgi:hypothetical protein
MRRPMTELRGHYSPVDSFIWLTEADADKDHFSSYSTYEHEYLHYLQHLTTPVGCQLRLRKQWYAHDQLHYLCSLKRPIILGTQGLIVEGLRAPERLSKESDDALKHLQGRHKQVISFDKGIRQNFQNAPELMDFCLKQDLRKTKPLEIDLGERAIYLKERPHVKVYFSSHYIMEMMAYLHELRVKDFGLSMINSQILVTEFIKRDKSFYVLPLLFLFQEGIFENILLLLKPHVLLDLLMVTLQTALLADSMSVDRSTIEKYKLRYEDYSPEFILSKCLHDGEIFSWIIVGLTGRSAPSMSEDFPFPSREVGKQLLKSIGFPTIQEMLNGFCLDMCDNMRIACRDDLGFLTDLMSSADPQVHQRYRATSLSVGQRRAMQIYQQLMLIKCLWSRDDYVADVSNLRRLAPAPIQARAGENGPVLTVSTDEDFWDIHAEQGRAILAHIADKLMNCAGVPCYDDSLGKAAMIKCPHVEECLNIPPYDKVGLSFCKNSLWTRFVRDFVRNWGFDLKL